MATTNESILLGGGCFWCIEAALQLIDGVTSVTSGYAGGDTPKPTYYQVCGGNSGHAEVVKVDWDSNLVDLQKILSVFFQVHDPTTLNRQGNDIGTQYRSFIGFNDARQKEICQNFIRQFTPAYDSPIVTELQEAPEFFPAEIEHQDYYKKNTNQPYCQIVIKPKLDKIT